MLQYFAYIYSQNVIKLVSKMEYGFKFTFKVLQTVQKMNSAEPEVFFTVKELTEKFLEANPPADYERQQSGYSDKIKRRIRGRLHHLTQEGYIERIRDQNKMKQTILKFRANVRQQNQH